MCFSSWVRSNEDSALWTFAVLTFGIGDVATTLYFLGIAGNFEGSPIAAAVISELGLWALIPLKVVVILAFFALARLSPCPPADWTVDYRMGIPLGLAILGSVTTIWNVWSSVTGTRILI